MIKNLLSSMMAAAGYLLNLKFFCLFLITFFALSEMKGQTVQTYSTAGTYTWTCPPGTTSIQVDAWGGGGAGGGTGATGGTIRTGGGGGGGAYTKNASVSVTPGTSYTIVVGAGGTAVSANNGNNGNSSTFATNLVVANGGNGGGSTNNGTGGASGLGGTGGTFSGGNGAAGLGTNAGSGGGGSSAGTGANGNNGSVTAGGIAPTGGSAGAAGVSSNGVGTAASGFSGGGSGSYAGTGSAVARAGGAGAAGKVIITYTGYCTPISSLATTYLSNVKTNSGITNFNNTTGYTSPGYANYFNTSSASQSAGATFTVSFTLVSGISAGVAIWIDWDKSNTFETSERVYNSAGYLSPGTFTTPTITVPAAQTAGDYVVRILTDYNATTPTSCSYSGTTQGEAEDYKLTVVALTPCVTPTAPTALSLTTASATSITGSFTASSPAPSGYIVVRSTSSSLSANPVDGTTYTTASTIGGGNVISVGAGLSIASTGLTSNTKYYYYVFAYNNTSCSGGPKYSTSLNNSATGQVTCAAAPTAATTPVTSITSSSATINWVASAAGGSAGTINYTVEVYTDSGYTTPVAGSPFNAGAATSQAITFTNASTTYYYRIKANNGTCDSTYLTGSFIPTCAAPVALAASATVLATGSSTISGSFTATGGTPAPTGYLVVRSTSPSLPTLTTGTTYTVGSNTVVATNGYVEYVGTTAGSWTSTSLSGGVTYYYFVFSYNNTSCSAGPIYSATATQNNATTPACPTFSSVISVGGSTTTPGSLYPTLTSAIADMASCGITQPTTISINASYTSASEIFPIVIPGITGSSATNTITIKPASGVSPTISGAAASNPLIKINGGSNVIIDGSNTVNGISKDLVITNTSATTPNVVLIGSPNTTPVTNVTLKNTILTNGINTSSAVIISSSTSIGAAGYFNNITIQNNSFRKAYNGLFINGNTAVNNGNGLVITGNDFNSSGVNAIRQIGIYIQGVDGTSVINNNAIGNISNANEAEYPAGIFVAAGTNKANIYGNTISGIVSTFSGDAYAIGINLLPGSTASAIAVYNNTISGISSSGTYLNSAVGISIGGATVNTNVYNNKISNIKNPNTSGYVATALLLGSSSATSNISLYNNMIWDIAGYGYASNVADNGHGIYVVSGAGYKIYYNSVNMTTNQTLATGITSALYVDSGVTTANALDIRNNIFANNQTTNTRYAFYSGATKTVYSNINYNDYYSTGTLAYLGAARTTLAALQATTGTGQDANSLNVIPPFTSATDLLIPATTCSTLVNAGTPISGITTDIENETRSATTPDMGADEFAGNIPPKVASVTGGSNCGTGTVVLGATGTSAGTPITEYRLYTASTGGTAVATSPTGTITTPSITTTTNYYVATFNGCESETRSLVTATINPAPTDIVLTPTISPVSADACGLDYVKLEATGGIADTALQYAFGTQASQNTATTTSAGYPAPYTVYYGGQKMQILIKASELTAAGYSSGSKITNIQFPVISRGSNWGTSLTANKDFQVSIGNTALNALTTTFQTGLTQVIAPTDFTPTVGYNNTHTFNTPFVWNGTSNIIIETTFSNNISGVTNDLVTQYYSPTSYVSTAVYRADSETSAAVAAATTITSGTNGFTYSARPDFKLNGSNTTQLITWTPTTGLYTDTALTIPYVGGANATTLYAAPTTATSYTAKAMLGTCEKVVTTASIQRLKKEFRGPGTDWNTAANWFPAQVPDNGKCATIPPTQTVVISSNAEAKSLTIAATGKTTITAGNSLTVTDAINITNNAANDNLVLESDANLLQVNSTINSGKMLAKRDVKMRRLDYTYWSSPVKDQPLLNTANVNAANSTGGFSEGSPNNRIFQYNESDDRFYATPDVNFIEAKGYAIRGKSTYDPAVLTTDANLKFVGTPNNGGYSINIKKSANTGTGGTVEHGYNLIGNPYPSNMDFVKFFFLGNNSNIINAKAWFWSNVTPVVKQDGSAYAGNNYATITLLGGTPPTTTVTPSPSTGAYIPTKNIKVGQAFIVQAKNLGINQTLTYDNSIRTNEAGVFFNNKVASDVNRYWLMLTTPDNIVNTILIGHVDGATNNYDANYDADILSLGDDSFYSKLNTQKLQIQARSNPLNLDDVIPLGSKYSANGSYKISLGNKEGIFGTNQKIYLFDKLNNLYTDLTSKDYIFTANKGTDETRFEIVYKNREVLASGDLTKSEFLVYRDGEYFVVRSSKILGNVELYDASGKLIVSKTTSQKELRLDARTIVSGVYIIKADNAGNIRTKKIIK